MSHTQYGIGVTKNRFELFDNDDEDPLEVLKVREQEREARKKTKLSEKENKGKETSVKGKQMTSRKGIKETQNIKPQEAHKHKEDSKGTKFPSRSDRQERRYNGDREERVLNRTRIDRPDDRPNYREREDRQFDRPSYREYRERAEGRGFYGGDGTDMRGRGRGGGSNRGGGVSRGGGRGGRGGRPFDTRGKREYERQSGSDKTGVKPVDKRDGSGAHNWGTHRDDLEDMHVSHQSGDDMQQWTNEKNDEGLENNLAPPPGEGDATINTEEEPKELTLDEWKAMRGPRPQPVYNLRKAGEGEDLSQWKKMYALKKKEGDEDDDEEDDEYESCEYPQRVGRQKHVLDIDIHFKDARGRSRGGRGGGRGGPRPGSRSNNPPVVDKPADLRYDITKKVEDLDIRRKTKQEEPRQKKSAPKVDDEHDFPSLG